MGQHSWCSLASSAVFRFFIWVGCGGGGGGGGGARGGREGGGRREIGQGEVRDHRTWAAIPVEPDFPVSPIAM